MAKWALGLRLPHLNDGDIETAFNEGDILRTHLLRPTWHFVAPADIRWMLALTAPRVHAINAFMYRKLELESKIFKRANHVFIKTLRDGKQLTRTELNVSLKRAKITADGLRLGYIFMQSELDGLICSGARSGKQFTYALLDERVPAAKAITRNEALAQITTRYFSSRGPATLNDFVTWSGLTMKDVKEGVAIVGASLVKEFINGKEYLLATGNNLKRAKTKHFQSTFLMPEYDEYGMAYKDRSAMSSPEFSFAELQATHPTFKHIVIVDGKFGGMWRKTTYDKSVNAEVTTPMHLKKTQQAALTKAIERFNSFTNNQG